MDYRSMALGLQRPGMAPQAPMRPPQGLPPQVMPGQTGGVPQQPINNQSLLDALTRQKTLQQLVPPRMPVIGRT